jgi:hypothetical protein
VNFAHARREVDAPRKAHAALAQLDAIRERLGLLATELAPGKKK